MCLCWKTVHSSECESIGYVIAGSHSYCVVYMYSVPLFRALQSAMNCDMKYVVPYVLHAILSVVHR